MFFLYLWEIFANHCLVAITRKNEIIIAQKFESDFHDEYATKKRKTRNAFHQEIPNSSRVDRNRLVFSPQRIVVQPKLWKFCGFRAVANHFEIAYKERN
jgi:hypothetical protein